MSPDWRRMYRQLLYAVDNSMSAFAELPAQEAVQVSTAYLKRALRLTEEIYLQSANKADIAPLRECLHLLLEEPLPSGESPVG